MIMTVAELRQFVDTEETDQVLEAKLQSLELMIRAYTNNNFQARAFRNVAVATSGNNQLVCNGLVPFRVGDTLEITDSDYMPNYLVTVKAVAGNTVTVNENLYDEGGVIITKVSYPVDVKMGVSHLMRWELDNRDKVGVSSETISRHSVTYFDMNGDNALMGYPKALLGFLKPYQKARFGWGV